MNDSDVKQYGLITAERQFEWLYRTAIAMVAILEILVCGSGRHVQLYVNREEWFDSYSFLRWIVVPITIFDAFYSAWRESVTVTRKGAEELQWVDKDVSSFQPWLKKYDAEITYFKVLIMKLLFLPVGATLLLKVDLIGLNDHYGNVGKDSIFLDKYQHRSLFYITISNVFTSVKKDLSARVVRYGISMSSKMSKFAVFHPKKFVYRISQVKVGIRWLKFLAPLIGTLNKLKGNIIDTIKKSKQYRDALIAAKVRRRLLNQLTPKELREESARHIQAAWRAQKVRKASLVIKEWRNNKQLSAAVKLQAIFRAKHAKMVVAQRKQQEHLVNLEEEERVEYKVKRLTKDERRRRKKRRQTIKNLRAQVREFKRMEASKRLLLIRPNTSFSVWWKIIRVSVIFIEIMQLLLPSLLVKGQKMTIEEALGSVLVSYPECNGQLEPTKTIFGRLITKSQKLDIDHNCLNLFPLKFIYFAFIKHMIQLLVVIANLVCFFDVPITFFTGDIHEETGMLIPKPFFQRWIVPGLLLQVLVNPVMANVFSAIRGALKVVYDADPGRVIRWAAAILPLCHAAFCKVNKWCLEKLEKLVKKQNERTVETSFTEI